MIETYRRWRQRRWARHHRPFDWALDDPRLSFAPAAHVRRVWPDPEPPFDELDPAVWLT